MKYEFLFYKSNFQHWRDNALNLYCIVQILIAGTKEFEEEFDALLRFYE